MFNFFKPKYNARWKSHYQIKRERKIRRLTHSAYKLKGRIKKAKRRGWL